MKLWNAKKPEINTEEIIKLYQEGLSSTQIGLKLGLCKSSVGRRLKKAQIKLRSTSDYSADKRYWLWKGQDYLDPLTRKRNQRKHRNWSKAVRKRDNDECTQCGISGVALEAHHLVSLKECLNSDLAFDVSNGITVCVPCHRKLDKR
jgi:hypothetical protein